MIRFYKGKLMMKRISKRCKHGKALYEILETGILSDKAFGSHQVNIGDKIIMPVRLGWRRKT